MSHPECAGLAGIPKSSKNRVKPQVSMRDLSFRGSSKPDDQTSITSSHRLQTHVPPIKETNQALVNTTQSHKPNQPELDSQVKPQTVLKTKTEPITQPKSQSESKPESKLKPQLEQRSQPVMENKNVEKYFHDAESHTPPHRRTPSTNAAIKVERERLEASHRIDNGSPLPRNLKENRLFTAGLDSGNIPAPSIAKATAVSAPASSTASTSPKKMQGKTEKTTGGNRGHLREISRPSGKQDSKDESFACSRPGSDMLFLSQQQTSLKAANANTWFSGNNSTLEEPIASLGPDSRSISPMTIRMEAKPEREGLIFKCPEPLLIDTASTEMDHSAECFTPLKPNSARRHITINKPDRTNTNHHHDQQANPQPNPPVISEPATPVLASKETSKEVAAPNLEISSMSNTPTRQPGTATQDLDTLVALAKDLVLEERAKQLCEALRSRSSPIYPERSDSIDQESAYTTSVDPQRQTEWGYNSQLQVTLPLRSSSRQNIQEPDRRQLRLVNVNQGFTRNLIASLADAIIFVSCPGKSYHQAVALEGLACFEDVRMQALRTWGLAVGQWMRYGTLVWEYEVAGRKIEISLANGTAWEMVAQDVEKKAAAGMFEDQPVIIVKLLLDY
ncbi:MAG: hypothetical protein M1834_003490 [Cirrosporium novae-zelandiae]|nr:MAG: hypothetical protein M1834_003490 [Cirrosporium novae-zelandiae]